MIENNPSNVSSAFGMLLEEIEAEIDFVNGVGSKAFEGRDYDKAKEVLERQQPVVAFANEENGGLLEAGVRPFVELDVAALSGRTGAVRRMKQEQME